eukprot:3772310-Pyramimonas_sp.AAC.1
MQDCIQESPAIENRDAHLRRSVDGKPLGCPAVFFACEGCQTAAIIGHGRARAAPGDTLKGRADGPEGE